MQTRSRKVEMPNGLSLPLVFGMYTLLIGSGRYDSCPSASASSPSQPLRPVRLDVREVLTIHARCALVGAALSVGMGQDVHTADLVVHGVEAIAGFCLRFRVQRRLQFLNTLRS